MGRAERQRKEQKQVVDTGKLQYLLNCFGFYGFASGWAQGMGLVYKDNEPYCSAKCPFTATCWEAIKQKAKDLWPDIVPLYEDLVRLHMDAGNPAPGQAALQDFMAEFNSLDPYSSISMNFMEDGMFYGKTGKPNPKAGDPLIFPFVGNDFPDEYFTIRTDTIKDGDTLTINIIKIWYLTDDPGKIIREEVVKSYVANAKAVSTPE